MHCVSQDTKIWVDCFGGYINCIYKHPELKNVMRLRFVTLKGSLDLKDKGESVKEVLIKFPFNDACEHVLAKHQVKVNQEICVSFACLKVWYHTKSKHFITDRSKAVVLMWFSVACFWCQSFGDVSPYVCSLYF